MAILSAHAARVLAAILLACALGPPLDAEAGDDRTEYQVKAAFLYNFAKFVEWPPETFKDDAAPIHICVLGSSPVLWMLADTVRNKSIDGRALTVREFADVSMAVSCQILFVGASERKNLRSILQATKSSDVLTVGETENFAADGGVVGFTLDQGRIRFDINLQAAQLQRLKISSKLLSLATTVKRAAK